MGQICLLIIALIRQQTSGLVVKSGPATARGAAFPDHLYNTLYDNLKFIKMQKPEIDLNISAMRIIRAWS